MKYPEYKYNLSNSDRISIASKLPSAEKIKRTIVIEQELHDKLKALCKQDMNFSAFIREILWEYADRFTYSSITPMDNSIASFDAIAHVPLTCTLTGEKIVIGENFKYVIMPNKRLYPVKING